MMIKDSQYWFLVAIIFGLVVTIEPKPSVWDRGLFWLTLVMYIVALVVEWFEERKEKKSPKWKVTVSFETQEHRNQFLDGLTDVIEEANVAIKARETKIAPARKPGRPRKSATKASQEKSGD